MLFTKKMAVNARFYAIGHFFVPVNSRDRRKSLTSACHIENYGSRGEETGRASNLIQETCSVSIAFGKHDCTCSESVPTVVEMSGGPPLTLLRHVTLTSSPLLAHQRLQSR